MFEDTLEKPWHTRVFGRIEDVATAENLAQGLGLAFIAVGAVGCIFAFKHGPVMLVEGLVYGVLGFLVWRIKSRAAASVLVGVEALAIPASLIRLTRQGGFAITGLWWAIVLLGASIRAVQATFAYHRLRQAADQPPVQPRGDVAVS